MINHLRKVKDSRTEKELRLMLTKLDDPEISKAALEHDPRFFCGYITMIHELLAEHVDTNKYFGIFLAKSKNSKL